MNNKKGISAIVATVLIILITVAAVTIIWAAIIPMVTNNLDKGKACLEAASGGVEVMDEGFTCKVTTSGSEGVSIQIKHGSTAFGLEDVQVIFTGNGNSASINLLENLTSETLPGVNEQKTYFLPGTSIGSVTITDLEEVSIAPIVNVGGKSTATCEAGIAVKTAVCT